MSDASPATSHNPADPAVGKPKRPGLFSITRTGVLLILVGHLLACAGVFWLMPGGWNWVSTEMLVYRLMPLGLAILILLTLVKRTPRLLSFAIETLRFLWLGLGVFCLAEGASSFLRLGIGCFAVGFVLTIAAKLVRQREPWSVMIARMVSVIALCYAVFHTLHSPAPSTTPAATAADLRLSDLQPIRHSVSLDGNVRLDPTQANITFSNGRRFVQVEPLLTFLQRSPDQTWTIFAPRTQRRPPVREFIGLRQDDASISAAYSDRDASTVAEHHLKLSKSEGDATSIESWSYVPRPVFSHLNTFTQITIAGHKQLSIEFSPIPGQRFDVPHAGYPFGSPATFAYVGANKRLHVVQASSGEKGPFRELGVGPIGESITMRFFDGDELLFETDSTDFAAQASTALSPAAGWGVPQNAIEFGRMSADPKSPATVYLSLAATSVGRGWSSVGHAAGMYRNRLIVRLPPNKPATQP